MRLINRVAATAAFLLILSALAAGAAPYAAMVMDARTGKVLHSRNADTRLHPASLTKMMTLYVVFQAVEGGEIGLDTKVRISRHAASEPPSKLGLKVGQRISIRHLIRAAAIRSANDAATALGEAISGSEAAFARRMTATAKQMGMSKTVFKNAHGLTQNGHLSTARDMTILGRRVIYDFPEYYHLFSRRTVDAGVATVRNTNRRLLTSFAGTDGIKTGYTRAAGFNLVASAHRGQKRVIATVFGGKSGKRRDDRVAQLLHMGFDRSPQHASVKPLPAIIWNGDAGVMLADGLRGLLPPQRPEWLARQFAEQTGVEGIDDAVQMAVLESVESVEAQGAADVGVVSPVPAPVALTTVVIGFPPPTPDRVKEDYRQSRLVVRANDGGPRNWGVVVGYFPSNYEAEKHLMSIALRIPNSGQPVERNIELVVHEGSERFRASFKKLNETEANMACTRLRAENEYCEFVAPTTSS